jgi:hypothetical protein
MNYTTTNKVYNTANDNISTGIPIKSVTGLSDNFNTISNQIRMMKKQCDRDKWLKRSHKKNRNKKYR